MDKSIEEFLKIVVADEELQRRLADAQDVDEAYAIASEACPSLIKEEFIAAVEELTDTSAEISLDDLGEVAGGYEIRNKYIVGITVSTGATVVLSASALMI